MRKIFSIIAIVITLIAFIGLPSRFVTAQGALLSCTPTEQSNAPNTIVTYSCSVDIPDTADAGSYSVSLPPGFTWETWLNPSVVGPFSEGESGDFTVSVAIPEDAALGQSSQATVTLSLPAGGAVNVTLITRAIPPQATVTPTVSAVIVRPLVVVDSYSPGGDIDEDEEFDLKLTLRNRGRETANNLIAVFESADFLPLGTGGVRALNSLGTDSTVEVTQRMLAVGDFTGRSAASVTVTLSYTGQAGEAFTETFNITVELEEPVYTGVAQPTATPTSQPRPQIVVDAYTSDVDPLQPGTDFFLALEMRNLGNSDAKAVTLVLGGSGDSVDVSSGTPQPGGVAGGGSDLTNFAPLGSSNLVYLGDVPSGAVVTASIHLIVNVSTNPGAYPLKLSYVYTDANGNRLVDDQVITLLVYSLPQVEINFFADPGVLMTGQPNPLPLQVNNLGQTTAVLGNLRITSDAGEVMNGTVLIGSLEPGGYFPLDAMFIPFQPGTATLDVTINYTDNFNKPRLIEQQLTVEVQEAPMMEPGMGEEGMPVFEPEPVQETFFDKVLRFLKGLIGLDSGTEEPVMPEFNEGRPEEEPGIESRPVPLG
jgi:hypothetical protein